MPVLTIESTCDETAAAVISESGDVLGQCVATQESLHEKFRGVVPEGRGQGARAADTPGH